jgi:hypothetical protein
VVLASLILGLAVAAAVLGGLAHDLTISNFAAPAIGISIYIVVGVVVARHQPGNPVGWILLSAMLLFLLSHDAGSYAVLHYRLGHHGLPLAPAAVLVAPLWVLAVALFPLVILLFPDGRLPRSWQWVLWVYAGLIACAMAVTLAPAITAVVGHDIHLDSFGDVTNTGPPASGAVAAAGGLLLVSIGVCWLSFLARQVLNWRRATGEGRQQLKWLACGAVTALVLGVLGAGGSSTAVGVFFFGIVALPVSIGVGILKYRLYDIDRIISRTLAYAIVTGLLVGVYAGLVLLATRVLSFSSPVAIAASTLAAAALFNPVRRRVQRAVDRRFNRARYDADRTVAAFAARLQDAMELDAVRADLAAVVQKALEPAHVSVWIRADERH